MGIGRIWGNTALALIPAVPTLVSRPGVSTFFSHTRRSGWWGRRFRLPVSTLVSRPRVSTFFSRAAKVNERQRFFRSPASSSIPQPFPQMVPRPKKDPKRRPKKAKRGQTQFRKGDRRNYTALPVTPIRQTPALSPALKSSNLRSNPFFARVTLIL